MLWLDYPNLDVTQGTDRGVPHPLRLLYVFETKMLFHKLLTLNKKNSLLNSVVCL